LAGPDQFRIGEARRSWRSTARDRWPTPGSRCPPPSPSTSALKELVERRLDLGAEPGRANVGDKLLSLVMSALAGGDCIDDADALTRK